MLRHLNITLIICLVLTCGQVCGSWGGTNPFRPPTFYDSGDLPFSMGGGELAYAVAVCDWDRDGVLDLLVTREHTDSILVLRNNHEGAFARTDCFQTSYRPGPIECMDLNKDGIEDIIVATLDQGILSVYLSTPSGYAPPSSFDLGQLPSDFEFGDLDEDGDVDLLVSEASFGFVRILTNSGSGGMSWTSSISHSGAIGQMAVGDVDEDGHLDIALASPHYSNRLEMLMGDGKGGFVTHTIPSIPDRTRNGIVAADMNGDSHLDLVTNEDVAGTVTVWLGDGSGAFVAQAPVTLGVPFTGRVVATDLDDDGDKDIVVGSAWFTLPVLFNNGAGQLGDLSIVGVGSNPNRPVLADLDQNGFPDLAVCLSDTDSVAVMLSASGGIVPTLISSVDYVYVGGNVTINWESSALRSVTATVYRQEGAAWIRRGTAFHDGVHGFRWVDRDVVPGQIYNYRLGVEVDGQEVFAGDVSIEIPEATHFALAIIGPNPSSGSVLCGVDLASNECATLSLWDIAGRRVVSRDVGSDGPGHHVVDLTQGAAMAPGVYVVRLEQGRHAKSLRVSVVR